MQLAPFMADVCRLAYEDDLSRISKKAEEWKVSNMKFVNTDNNTQVMMFTMLDDELADRDVAVIAFRGTESDEVKDILTDLKFWHSRSKIGPGNVHSGFQESMDDVHDDVVRWLETMKRWSHSHGRYLVTVCTGHSMGGAIATLCAARLDAQALYTFGSPRVGTWEFCDSLHAIHYRFVNNNDVVSSLPPPVYYWHHQDPKYINRKGNLCNMTLWQRIKDKTCSWLSAMSAGRWADGVADHAISEYSRLLHKNLDLN